MSRRHRGRKSASVFFDDDHDGLQGRGRGRHPRPSARGTPAATLLEPDGTCGAATTATPRHAPGTTSPSFGTRDVVAGATEASGLVTFELRHPLCSVDDTHDFCLAEDDTVGVLLEYQSGAAIWFYPGGSPLDPSDWADLTISASAHRHRQHRLRDDPRRRPRDLPDERRRLVADEADRRTRSTDNLPSISPDGTKVAFTSDRDGGTRHLRDEHRRHGRHAADDRPGHRPAAGLVARRDEDRLRQQHRRSTSSS